MLLKKGNAAENAYRDLGGYVDLAALGLPGVEPGSDFFVRFDANLGVSVPEGAQPKKNQSTAAFIDNVRVSLRPRAMYSAGAPVPTASITLRGLLCLLLLGAATRALRDG